MKKRRLTQAEFDTIRPLIRMTPERVESARLVLVDGMTYEAAGRLRPGPKPYTRQAVGDAVGIVLRVHESYLATQEVADHAGKVLPPGWEAVTLVAPSALIAEFRARVAGLGAPAKAPRVRARRTTRAEA
jgi:hypothetical protein